MEEKIDEEEYSCTSTPIEDLTSFTTKISPGTKLFLEKQFKLAFTNPLKNQGFSGTLFLFFIHFDAEIVDFVIPLAPGQTPNGVQNQLTAAQTHAI